MATYTVPTTGVYDNSRTGGRFRHVAGAVIDLALAVDLGMPGAALPAAGPPFNEEQVAYIGTACGAPPTIRNYFPDGRVTSAALIDVGGDFDDALSWRQSAGTETLSFAAGAGHAGGNAVGVSIPGSFSNEGVIVGDWGNTYGCRMPSGFYRVGFWIRGAQAKTLRIASVASTAQPEVSVEIGTTEQFVSLAFTQTEPSVGGVKIATNADDGLAAAVFYVSRLMITDGDPTTFADGDSDGWTWEGTPLASASYGPQP